MFLQLLIPGRRHIKKIILSFYKDILYPEKNILLVFIKNILKTLYNVYYLDFVIICLYDFEKEDNYDIVAKCVMHIKFHIFCNFIT